MRNIGHSLYFGASLVRKYKIEDRKRVIVAERNLVHPVWAMICRMTFDLHECKPGELFGHRLAELSMEFDPDDTLLFSWRSSNIVRDWAITDGDLSDLCEGAEIAAQLWYEHHFLNGRKWRQPVSACDSFVLVREFITADYTLIHVGGA